MAQRRNEEWCALPKLEQDRKVLEALGDDRLTNTELGTRLDEGEGPCPYTNDSSVAIITRRLYKAGELKRQEGQFGMSRVRYSRAKPNEALKKLDEQLTDGEVAVATGTTKRHSTGYPARGGRPPQRREG